MEWLAEKSVSRLKKLFEVELLFTVMIQIQIVFSRRIDTRTMKFLIFIYTAVFFIHWKRGMGMEGKRRDINKARV